MSFTATSAVPLPLQPLHRRTYQTILNLKNLNILTESNLGSITTWADLKTAMETTMAGLPIADQIAGARLIRFLVTAKANSLLTDAQINTAGGQSSGSRISNLYANFSAVDDALTNLSSGQPMARE